MQITFRNWNGGETTGTDTGERQIQTGEWLIRVGNGLVWVKPSNIVTKVGQ